MKNNPLNFICFRDSRITFKAISFLAILFFCSISLSAQTESNIILKIETGTLWTSKTANTAFPWFNGFFLNIEPKLKTSKNTVIGLRIGVSENEKIETYRAPQLYYYDNPYTGLIQFTNPDNASLSILPTFNYYLKNNKFDSYFGFGLGYYFLTNFTKVTKGDLLSSTVEVLDVAVENRVGFVIRGGLNLGKFVVGLEYNLIPKAEIKISDGQIMGKVNNSYIGLSIGYEIGFGNG